ncbi:hypothetical protein ccbrp13_41970 [Ktedonobacteria bacterium brp13]|nr:hypothetical protein ccbrp13_41970 [Ktedonobacteria bacterium brp13]
MESTFEEARAHIGIETQRQWSDLAIERTTPLLLCTYSLVTLIGTHLAASEQIAVEQTAWYRKSAATFHDVLAAVRLHIWKLQSNTTSPHDPAGGAWSHVPCSIGFSMLPVISWKCTKSSFGGCGAQR